MNPLAAALALTLLSPAAWGRDTLRDCDTFGPHSASCARAIEKRSDPGEVAKQQERLRAREKGLEGEGRRGDAEIPHRP